MEKVTISNLQGESGLVNVVRYFSNNGAEFLIYSLNEVDESGYTRLYVTKLTGSEGNFNADTLNDAEWADIKNLVKVIVKANKEKLPVPVQDLNPRNIKNIVLKDKKIFKLNTPLVNDLSANQPVFEDNDSSADDGGMQKTSFEMPGAPTFDTPAQPAFEMPSAPTFDTPAQPAFDMPSAPTFDTPAQPAFDMPSAPTFDAPAQPTFDTPSAPTFDAPAQPAFDMPSVPTFDAPAQPTFDMPSAPTFDTPAQPAFEMPGAPTFDTPAQPTFDIPSAPTFDTPAQPTFDIPSAPAFDTPAQPAFEMPSAPTFDTPAQPTSSYNTFDFGATNTFANEFETPSSENVQSENVQDLKDEIKRLNEEISKYKAIVENVKNIVEK